LATHTYAVPGTYNVCLYINSQFGCKDTICDTIKIIPNIITLPNVITTNGDGINDILYFQYLPFYGISSLSVFNRWGEIVYESNDYQNNWAPTQLTDGTYFYILKVPGHDPYTSTLNVFSKP
jgi:gliding motility-associated-like protein